jgi:hypothetical protein
MKKLITTIAAAAAITVAAHAERVEVGEYFSLDIPSSWTVEVSGLLLNNEGNYPVYVAHGYSCLIRIDVVNPPEIGITFEEYSNFKDPEDCEEYARINHRVGWTKPIVRKDKTNTGIPVILFRQKNKDDVRALMMTMWIGGKQFTIQFVYTAEAIKVANRIIDSIAESKASSKAKIIEAAKGSWTAIQE